MNCINACRTTSADRSRRWLHRV